MPRWTGYAEQSHQPEQPTLLQIVRAKRSEMARAALKPTRKDLDRRAKKAFLADRNLCEGWSTWNGKRCELFAREGSDYCRYHDNDPAEPGR